MEMYAARQTGIFSARYLPDQSLSDIDSVFENSFSVHRFIESGSPESVLRSEATAAGYLQGATRAANFTLTTDHIPTHRLSSHLGQISLITAVPTSPANPLYITPVHFVRLLIIW